MKKNAINLSRMTIICQHETVFENVICEGKMITSMWVSS